MADLTQAKSTILTHQAVTNPESVQGTEASVAASLSGMIICRHAYIESGDPGGIEPTFHIMGSIDAAGDDGWFKILSLKATDPGGVVATEPMTATEPIGEKSLACALTAGFAAGNEIYVRDTTTETDSEWHIVDNIINNLSINIFTGLAVQKDAADIIWGSAQTFRVPLDFSGLSRVNVYYSNEGVFSMNTAVLVELLQATDIE